MRSIRTAAPMAIILALLTPTAPTSARAQAGAPAATPYRNVLSLNPLAIPFEIVSAEFETRLSPSFSFGIAASYFSPDIFTISSLDARLKVYPNEEGPKGFAVALSVGAARLEDDICCSIEGGKSREVRSFPTTGIYLDYNWLLGKSKRMVVGTGVGAKRLFGDASELAPGNAYPTARLQLGWIF